MLPRERLRKRVVKALKENPVVALVGPRQCGKTTLARAVLAGRRGTYLDLEDPTDAAALASPKFLLEPLRGLVVLDEIQRKPALFELLRVLADRPGTPARFLVPGSASPHLVRGVSESLAGRIHFIDMAGFELEEVGPDRFRELWLRGGFPRSFLARTASRSLTWRNDFIRTFLERDVPGLGFGVPASTLRRFWTMVAHYHGQLWSGAEFARALGSSEPTARRYLDLLEGAFVVRQLQPWLENLGKRQVKSPKLFVRDSGLLHALLLLPTTAALAGHPKAGASWEGFVVEQALALTQSTDAYFWATHGGAELDLLLFLDGRRVGLEVKLTDTPSTTRSMHLALSDLQLDRLLVVHPGERSWKLAPRLDACSIRDLRSALV